MSREQIEKKVLERKKAETINRIIAHQNRVKFHAETKVAQSSTTPTRDFLAYAESLLPKDKYRAFLIQFRVPMKTSEVVGTIFDKMSNIFDGQNQSFNYQFLTTEYKDDFEYYRQEVLKEPEIWYRVGWEYYKTEFNSILVVDLPIEQTTELPEPYFYWLKMSNVIDYETTDPLSGMMEYVIFKQTDSVLTVVDDESYKTYEYKNDKIGDEISNNPHDLGYCPAKFFWNEPLNLSQPDIKASLISKELNQFDWLEFFHINKKQLDLYSAYPILWSYKQNCNYMNADKGYECDGGFLVDKHKNHMLDSNGHIARCPVCEANRLTGAGSLLSVPPPSEKNGDMREPVGIIEINEASLRYNVEEEQRLIKSIIDSTVGVDDNLVNSQAVNEQQVNAVYESRSTVRNKVKRGFEQAQQFVDETVARLRYGNDTVVSVNISLGTVFYNFTGEQLRLQYKSAKDSGASEAELDMLQERIFYAEYKNDATQLQRILILSELEPFRHYTRNEVIDLFQKGFIDEQTLKIKLNFSDLIKRFERENLNIIEFGSLLDFNKKINIINDKLKNYVTES